MKKIILTVLGLILIWVMFAQCFIMRNRLSDSRATAVFESKKVPLTIFDSVINGRHLHYAVSGDSTLPTLVFVHGSPGSWMNYMKFMYDSSLLSRYRLVSVDRPGFGYSDFGEAMHLRDQSALLLEILKTLKSEQPMILCGHSMGGPVVVQLAAMDTLLFSKIIIVAGSIDVNQEKVETWRKVMNIRPLYWLLPGAFGPSNTELLYLKKALIKLREEFVKVKCDVQFIHGDKDTWVPIENVGFGVRMLSKAKSITSDTIKGADHQIPWKNKAEFTDLLLKAY